jgi:flagellar hook protein FlgE
MLRSMFSGVSGLRSHQTMMDVIGNNIANVNTVGYKSSSVIFQDMLSQVLSGAGVPTSGPGGLGGTNPSQVGLGVKIGGIATSFRQGASQLTGNSTDISIQGDGFFLARSDSQTLFTRAGALSFDALGRLVTQDGGVLQGWTADSAGAVNTNAGTADLNMPLGQAISPQVTSKVSIGGNLEATPPATFPGPEVMTTITVFDQLGKALDLTFGMKMTAANTWSMQPYTPDGSDAGTAPDPLGAAVTVTFDPATGKVLTPATSPTVTIPASFGTYAGPVTIDLGQASADGLRQFAGKSTVSALSQDGATSGSLQSFTIGADGTVTGVFSNGRNRVIGQIAMASFSNPSGLEKVGGSLYRPTPNSGLAQVGVPGSGGRGSVSGGTLEMSNVDLAQEFTSLIAAQRGFQANSRVITTADELLQELVNLKR